MPIEQLSEVRLEYFVRGHGPRRLVLLHGFRASALAWRLVQEALPPEQYTSAAINNRGAGGSDAPRREEDFSIQAFAADVVEWASRVDWPSFALVGHSLGAAIALQLALDHPELVESLVLLAPADPDGHETGIDPNALERILNALAERWESRLASETCEADITTDATAIRRELLEDMRAAPARRFRGALRSALALRLGGRLSELAMPVLLAGGDADEEIPVSSMLETWAKLPQGSGLHIWHGVGHSPILDCPDDTAALLRRFTEAAQSPSKLRGADAAAMPRRRQQPSRSSL